MLKKGTVIQSNGSNYIVSCDNQHYDCVIKGKLRQKGYNSTNPVAVGDFVEFDISKDPATITQIFERRNCIIRKSTNLSKQSHIIAANIDQAVFVFTMRQPETTTVFLDRFLVSAESYSIPTIIIFNKIDIYKPEVGCGPLDLLGRIDGGYLQQQLEALLFGQRDLFVAEFYALNCSGYIFDLGTDSV